MVNSMPHFVVKHKLFFNYGIVGVRVENVAKAVTVENWLLRRYLVPARAFKTVPQKPSFPQ